MSECNNHSWYSTNEHKVCPFCADKSDNDRLREINAELVAAAESALALIKNTWILDHGNPEVGDAWGALHSALNKAKEQS